MNESLFQDDATPADLLDRYARVVVERGIDTARSEEGFTYRLSRAVATVSVGERVLVPFGRGNKPAAGIVVELGGPELLGDLPKAKAKPISRATGVRLPEPLIELARWMADYYVCPLGMVLSAMLPAAVKRSIGRKRVIELDFAERPDLTDTRLPPATRQAWALLEAQRAVLPAPPAEVVRRLGLSSAATLNRLVRLGLLRRVERTVYVSPPMPWEGLEVEGATAGEVEPTTAQREIIDALADGLGAFSTHLLYGVTGSGKTEVYLRVMERVLDTDGTALMLVPEIALTPQTAGRVFRRFGEDRVAVLHSGLTASQRTRQWAHAASGECRVVVGARSAIFAPLPRLSLIVVDEEHAGDYKQDQLPRYNARDVAIKRAQIERCPVLLGSATPSLESWSNARAGRYRLWKLKDRLGGGRLPRVEIVDVLEESRARRESQPGSRPSTTRIRALGPRLERALGETLDAGGQAILLLNRRGFSNILACAGPRCDWVLGCDDCDTTMVLHRHRGLPAGQVLRCHHCLAQRLVPKTCPVCGSGLAAIGMGTQRLEVELSRTFEQLREKDALMRLDSDTMGSAKDYFVALSRFARGDVRVLMGTQVVSRGLDFPNVRLVGVVSADTALWMPDFRASERTFQLVSQVAGRAGRGTMPGRVIVQTLNPGQPAIRHAATHDYESFADEELALRQRAGLPPATRMARLVVRDRERDAALSRAAVLAERLRAVAGSQVRVIGPMPAPIERIAGMHRIAIEMIAPTAADLLEPLRALRAAGLVKSDAQTAIDVDPIWLM